MREFEPDTDEEGFEVDVYPRAITLPLLGQRQLKVKSAEGESITNHSSGIRYFISDTAIADLNADGLLVAKQTGVAKISVVYGGSQYDLT